MKCTAEQLNFGQLLGGLNCLIFFIYNTLLVPRLRSRPKLVYDQTQSSAHPCVPRPKLHGLEGSSSALQSGWWSGDGLIRGRFGLKSLVIGGFKRTWVWSEPTSSAIASDHNLFERTSVWSEAISIAIGSDHNLFERTWVWSEMFSNAIGSDQGLFRAHYFFNFFVFLLRDVGSAKRQLQSSVLIRDPS